MDKSWEVFEKTGKVTDYLKYRGILAGEEAAEAVQSAKPAEYGVRRMNCETAEEWLDMRE